MSQYIGVIRMAVSYFPLIALVMSVPFMLLEYHRFGALSFFKGVVVYSFVLYMTCAYCLIILPLPDVEEVAKYTSPWCNFIPFRAVYDFFHDSPFRLTQPSTWLKAIKHKSFYTVAFNLVLTLPFGMYVRYYLRAGWKKTLLLTFLLSLFFELTQVTGLYFIYPRPYRLCDVDDLITNSLGGLLGWVCAGPFLKVLPSREAVESDALRRGRRVSGLRRTVALFLDMFLFGMLTLLLYLPRLLPFWAVLALTFVLYYVIISHLLGGSAPAEAFLRLRIVDARDRNSLWRLILRRLLFVAVYFGLPILAVVVSAQAGQAIITLAVAAVMGAFYMGVGIKYLFTNKPMSYEHLSGTRMVSTLAG